MTRLSVNVNKLATLRNSRGKNLPNVAAWAEKILGYGADGITVHPRPDARHIRRPDVLDLRALTRRKAVEFNVEGYPSSDFLELLQQVQPEQCTLVPDPPDALTSNAGWDLVKNERFLHEVLSNLHGMRVSLFLNPADFSPDQASALLRLKPSRIELYTEAFADHFGTRDQDRVTAEYKKIAEVAQRSGIGVNAGHDLNQKNLALLVKTIPWLDEVSIGHALICEALEQGMATTIQTYLRVLGGR